MLMEILLLSPLLQSIPLQTSAVRGGQEKGARAGCLALDAWHRAMLQHSLGETGESRGNEQKHKQRVTSSLKAAATSSICRLSSFPKQCNGFLWSCHDTQWAFSMQLPAL